MTLADIIARLEAAEGPSLELDGQIWCAANGYEFVMWDGAGCVYRDPAAPKWDDGIKHAQASIVRPFSASVDAAISLAERLLPGWHYYVGGCPSDFLTDKDKPFSAELMGPVTWGVIDREVGEEPIYDTSHASAPTAPLALVLSTLRALSKQEEQQL